LGKIWTAVYMIVCLVMLALPVGVVGGNFSQEWSNFDKNKKNTHATRKREQAYITAAIQRIDPSAMSKLMFIELWNERFPPKINGAWGEKTLEGLQSRPHPAEFMGHARLELDLPDTPIAKKEVILPLKDDPDVVNRKVSGFIKVQYEWRPATGVDERIRNGWDQSCAFPGTLFITLCFGEGLINLNCSDAQSASNPYCMLYCYPHAPANDALIKPTIWRSPTLLNTLTPQWHVSHAFDFHWVPTGLVLRSSTMTLRSDEEKQSSPTKSHSELQSFKSDLPEPANKDQMGEVLSLMKGLVAQVTQVQSDMQVLTDRVDKLSTETRPLLVAVAAANPSSS